MRAPVGIGAVSGLADDAYMPKGPRLGSAFEQWRRAKDAGVARLKDRNPPVGAQMFWDPVHSAGHIATYVGDGKAVTNMPDGSVKAINWRAMNDWDRIWDGLRRTTSRSTDSRPGLVSGDVRH